MNIRQIVCSQAAGKKLVCPWQIAPLMDNFFRPLIHNPRKLFSPYVRPGMIVLDVGCGAGFASLGLAGLVGKEGIVIATDLQPRMLDMVRKRAVKAGLENRIHSHLCASDSIGINKELDFVVAFFMLHEVPKPLSFFRELYGLLKIGGLFFLAEPKIHVSQHKFERSVREAQSIGFTLLKRPVVRFGRAALLSKRI